MATLMVLRSLKEQRVEEPGLLSSDFPTAEPGARRTPDGGQGGGKRVQPPHSAHGSAILRDGDPVSLGRLGRL